MAFGLTAALAAGCTSNEGSPNSGPDTKPTGVTPSPTVDNDPGCLGQPEHIYSGAYPVRYLGAAGIILDKKRATEVTIAAATAAKDYLAGKGTPAVVTGTAVAYGTEEQFSAQNSQESTVMWTMSAQAAEAVMSTAEVKFGLPRSCLRRKVGRQWHSRGVFLFPSRDGGYGLVGARYVWPHSL